MLFFKAKFLPLIRSGRKRQTIRLWRGPRVKAGQRAYVPGLGRVVITNVDKLVSLAVLTRADAVADGFGSRREMLAEIRRLYAGVKGKRSVYRVKFKWDGVLGAKREKSLAAGGMASSTSERARREALRKFVVTRERAILGRRSVP